MTKRYAAVLIGAVLWTPLTGSHNSQAICYPATVDRVLDGDTIVANVQLFEVGELALTLSGVRLRLVGIDTPEKSWRANCKKEKYLGEAASGYTKLWLEHSQNKITACGFEQGKYSGRALVSITNNDGESLRDRLLLMGLGVPYDGGRKPVWCD